MSFTYTRIDNKLLPRTADRCERKFVITFSFIVYSVSHRLGATAPSDHQLGLGLCLDVTLHRRKKNHFLDPLCKNIFIHIICHAYTLDWIRFLSITGDRKPFDALPTPTRAQRVCVRVALLWHSQQAQSMAWRQGEWVCNRDCYKMCRKKNHKYCAESDHKFCAIRRERPLW